MLLGASPVFDPAFGTGSVYLIADDSRLFVLHSDFISVYLRKSFFNSSISQADKDVVFADMRSLQAPANNNWNQIGPENPDYSAGSDT